MNTDYESLFHDAIHSLAAIDIALGIGDDGCGSVEKTLDAISGLTISEKIIGHNGFFRIQKGSRVVGLNDSVVAWSIGVSVVPGKVSWWHGETFSEAAKKTVTEIEANNDEQ